MYGMTTGEVAKIAGCSVRAVTNICQRLGIEKHVPRDGGHLMYYELTSAQVKTVLAKVGHRAGRPEVERPWEALGISRQWYYKKGLNKKGRKVPRGSGGKD